MIVVIDGPAGAGKSTTAKAVARIAGLDYIDSGAIYRGFAVLYNQMNRDKVKFFEAIETEPLHFEFERDDSRVFLNNREVTGELRSDEVNEVVSEVAAMPEIRNQVSLHLKKAVKDHNNDCIAEGRDLGSVVFPEADLKFFLTADLDERARRRHSEAAGTTENQNEYFSKIRRNLSQRDHIDSSRKDAPLTKAQDAIELDTTSLSFDSQVNKITEAINRKRNEHSDSSLNE